MKSAAPRCETTPSRRSVRPAPPAGGRARVPSRRAGINAWHVSALPGRRGVEEGRLTTGLRTWPCTSRVGRSWRSSDLDITVTPGGLLGVSLDRIEHGPDRHAARRSDRRPAPPGSPNNESRPDPMTSTDRKRIFPAGATGVLGQRLVPRLVQAGHVVGGMTRTPGKIEVLERLGAQPILCDVFDRDALIQAIRDFEPDIVLNELTDLPDDASQIGAHAELNARIRTEGSETLIAAAQRSGSPKILAQSVAWQLPDGPDARAVAELERSVLAEGGVVLRYGQFYGPGTYNEQQRPDEPRVRIDRAAERTVAALGEPSGVVVITD